MSKINSPKYILFLLTILFTPNTFAQGYMAYYDYVEINAKTQKISNEERMRLRIEKKMWRFDSENEKVRKVLRDSLIKAGKETHIVLAEIKHLPKGSKIRIFSDIQKGELIVYDYYLNDMYYREAMPVINWNFSTDSTKDVCSYASKKATAHIYGRDWVAYYTEDIPIGAGPWKISGLPGLVTEAFTTDGTYHFTLVGIEQLPKEREEIKVKSWANNKDATERTKKEVLEKRYLLYTDPMTLIKQEYPNATTQETRNPETLRKFANAKKVYQYIEQ